MHFLNYFRSKGSKLCIVSGKLTANFYAFDSYSMSNEFYAAWVMLHESFSISTWKWNPEFASVHIR